MIESGAGKTSMALYPTPGLLLAYDLGTNPIRGEVTFNGRSFAVSGTNLVELQVNGATTSYAGLTNDGQPVSMVGGGAAGNLQLLVVSAGLGYVFNMQTNVLTQIPVAMQTGPWARVHFIDGFFVAVVQNSDTFQLSNLEDATTWLLTQVGQVSLFSDNIVTSIEDHRELWLIGPTRGIVYYDSGDPLFAFSPIPGAFIEQGAIAPLGICRADNSVFWLGGDERGAGIVWRAQGYNPVRISNHAIETAFKSYPTLSDAIMYPYQENGHTFCVVHFPSADKTWTYDIATGMWHQRGFWNGLTFKAHRARFHTFNFGLHLVGDYTTGKIYQMTDAVYNDFGNSIRRVRRAPHISTEQEWIFHSQLQVDAEVGLGSFASGGLFLQDANGQIWSITADSTGLLHSTAVPSGTVSTLFLNDSTNLTSWQLGITVAGLLTTTSVTLNAAYPTTYLLANAFASWNLGITNVGLLTTTAIALGTPLSPSGSPTFMLRWSDDGGHTWSNEYQVTAGAPGQYKFRSIWRRLGRSRDRVYELSVSDNAAWRIVDAYLQATPGYTPSERLSSQYRKIT